MQCSSGSKAHRLGGHLCTIWVILFMFTNSLARHTPQSEGKRGLVTMRTTSCSGDQNWSRPIRFEIWIYCLATLYWRRARNTVSPALFAITRDMFCNYCIPTEQLAVRMVTRPSFSWDWRVWLARLVSPMVEIFCGAVLATRSQLSSNRAGDKARWYLWRYVLVHLQ